MAELLASELVTNAVRHTAGPRLCLAADVDGVLMRVTVEDSSTEPLPQPPPHVHATMRGGRGLWLVEQLSHRWGWQAKGSGKEVWFELRC